MKITKSQLRQLVKEEFEKEYPPATKIESRANMINDLISRSVIKMVMDGASTDAIIEQLQRIAALAREISVKAKALPRE
jgi:6-phosphogluconate dehydrogenase